MIAPIILSHNLHLSINEVEIVGGYYGGMELSLGWEPKAQLTMS